MSIHSRVHHSGVDKRMVHYRMEVLRKYKSPLDRQIGEALFIARSSANVRMNSGAEWRFNALPRASVSRPREL